MPYVENPNISWLLSRAYGQGGTVALPSKLDDLLGGIQGEFPAGVVDVLKLLEHTSNNWNSETRDLEWCFLVGGPGNGKSESLKYLAQLVHLDLPMRNQGDPASRTIPEQWPDTTLSSSTNLKFVLINDASIPRTQGGSTLKASLYHDLKDAINKCFANDPLVLFCNINRGVLLEELSAANDFNTHDSTVDLIIAMLNWLINPHIEEVSVPNFQVIVPTRPQTQYYGQAALKIGYWNIRIHAIFLDALSLLEPTPHYPNHKSIDLQSSSTRVAPYRTFGMMDDNTNSSARRESTIAGSFLEQLVGPERWQEGGCITQTGETCEAAALCPFFHNAKWLQSLVLRRHLLDFLRAAEIAASRRFTYRDLVGHASLVLIGAVRSEWLSGMHPCQWIHDRTRGITTRESLSKKSDIAQLVSHRVYNNIFPSTDVSAWKKLKVQPRNGDSVYRQVLVKTAASENSLIAYAFEQAFNMIDPARDVDGWNGLREKVVEAIEALDIKSPSIQLLEDEIVTDESISPLEQELDDAISAEIFEEFDLRPAKALHSRAATTRIKALRKWRNTLLLRHVGLSRGFMNFKYAVSGWLEQQKAVLQHTSTQLQLWNGIHSLLFQHSTDNKILLAPFRPRTYTISQTSPPINTLLVAVNHNSIRVQIVPRGDSLTAEIIRVGGVGYNQPEVVLAVLIIDLLIAREALIQSNSHLHRSFTEIGSSAFARVERVRASLISRKNLNYNTIEYRDEQGRLYQLVEDPLSSDHYVIQASSV